MTEGNTSSRILATWSDCAVALDELIERSQRTLDIVDRDLRLQGWESLERAESLRRAMHERGVQVRMALCETNHLASELPRLFNLLKTHGHKLSIVRPEKRLQSIEFMAVADGQHSLFRPILVHSNGFAYFENRSKSTVYSANFKVLWEQGGRRLFPESFGL
jgi:hypothetical protein